MEPRNYLYMNPDQKYPYACAYQLNFVLRQSVQYVPEYKVFFEMYLFSRHSFQSQQGDLCYI